MMWRKGIVIAIIVLFIGASVTPSITGNIENNNEVVNNNKTTSETDWWPSFRHDQNNTGYSTSGGPVNDEIKWSLDTSYERWHSTSPIIVNNLVYMIADNDATDDELFCINAETGEIKWHVTTKLSGGYYASGPTVAYDRVYCGAGYWLDAGLYCYDAYTGDLLWNYSQNSFYVISNPVVNYGKVYCIVDEGLFCFDAYTGEYLWEYSNDNFYGSPAISNGKIYICTTDGLYCYCLNAYDGSLIWDYFINADGSMHGSPVVSNDKVYFMISYEGLYCLNALTGDLLWKNGNGYQCYYISPAIAYEKVYYVFGDKLFCVDANNGSYIWEYEFIDDIYFSSPIVADEKIYIADSEDWYNPTIYCFDAYTGESIWNYTHPNQAFYQCGPAIANDLLYIGFDDVLYCFGSLSQPVADFIWTPSNPPPDVTINFDASDSYDPNGYITLYEWDWNNDGIYDESHTTPITTHSWSEEGTYPVQLRITDNESKNDTKIKKVYVYYPPPVAQFYWTPEKPVFGEIITFDASDSYDPDGTVELYEWDWDNDGIYDESYIEPTVTHSWAQEGNYPVTLRVTDNNGSVDKKTKTVIVYPGENIPPIKPVITSGHKTRKVNQMGFYITKTTDIDGHWVQYRFDWDAKGSHDYSSWSPLLPSGFPWFRFHSWGSVGEYIVKVQARDQYGAYSEWSIGYLVKVGIVGDLNIIDLEPIQVVNNPSKFVVGKNTVAKVVVENTFDLDKKAFFKITYDFGKNTWLEKGKSFDGVLLKPGINTIYLPGGPSDAEPNFWWKYYFFNWDELIWTSSDTDTQFSVEVDPTNMVQESNENNNVKTCSPITFQEPRNLKVGFVRIKSVWPDDFGCPSYKDFRKTVDYSDILMENTYPVKNKGIRSSSFSYAKGESIGLWGFGKFLRDLGYLQKTGEVCELDRMVGVVNKGYWEDHSLDLKAATIWFHTSSIVTHGYYQAAAHEIHHNLPHWDDWRSGIPGCKGGGEEYDRQKPGFKAEGFRMWSHKPIINGYCFMGRAANKGTFYTWYKGVKRELLVCNDCYEHLLDCLEKGDPIFSVDKQKIIYISGFIFKNDTVDLEYIYVLENRTVDYPTGGGNYSLELIDNNNQVVMEIFFDLLFKFPWINETLDLDVCGFAFKLPYPETIDIDLTKIQIKHNDTIINQYEISENVPTVNLLSPNGGEEIILSNNYTISWDGNDIDGDEISYDLLFSNDTGENWTNIASDIYQTEFTWNTTFFSPGSQCRVRIIANDGFNTAIDDSDGTFNLINSPPNKPIITGPTSGKTGIDYEYTFVTEDFNADLLYYLVDWGDEYIESWIGPLNSSEEITVSHNWSERGTYKIKVKAMDIHDAESDWSELTVTMPRDKAISSSLFLWFLERYPILQRLLLLME